MSEHVFEGRLLRGQRLVFFRSGKLRFRQRLFTVGDPLPEFSLCVSECGDFLGRNAPRFNETLNALVKPLLQLVLRSRKRSALFLGKPLRLGHQVLRFRQPPLDVGLLRECLALRLFRRAARFGERLRESLQFPLQLIVPRGKFRALRGGHALSLGRGVTKFHQPAFQFRLRGLGGVPLRFERVIRLREACLQFHLRFEKPGMFLAREPDGLRLRCLRVGELAFEFIPQLHEGEIFLIRGTLRLLQRAQRRRETSVDFIPLRGQRCVQGLRLVARLLKGALHPGQLPFECRTRLRLRRVLRLRRPPCIRQCALGIREPLLRFLRDGTQRFFLFASPARGVRHRLLKFRDLPLDVRLFSQQRGAFLIRGLRGVGKCLLARRNFRVRGREFLADLFEFRRKTVLRLLVLRLQPGQLFPVPGALGGQLGFDLRVETLGVREPALRLLPLRDERLARAVQRSAQVLVMRACLGELGGDEFPFPPRLVALRRQRREILPAGFFKLRERDRHTLHLRLRLVAFP